MLSTILANSSWGLFGSSGSIISIAILPRPAYVMHFTIPESKRITKTRPYSKLFVCPCVHRYTLISTGAADCFIPGIIPRLTKSLSKPSTVPSINFGMVKWYCPAINSTGCWAIALVAVTANNIKKMGIIFLKAFICTVII